VILTQLKHTRGDVYMYLKVFSNVLCDLTVFKLDRLLCIYGEICTMIRLQKSKQVLLDCAWIRRLFTTIRRQLFGYLPYV